MRVTLSPSTDLPALSCRRVLPCKSPARTGPQTPCTFVFKTKRTFYLPRPQCLLVGPEWGAQLYGFYQISTPEPEDQLHRTGLYWLCTGS